MSSRPGYRVWAASVKVSQLVVGRLQRTAGSARIPRTETAFPLQFPAQVVHWTTFQKKDEVMTPLGIPRFVVLNALLILANMFSDREELLLVS